VRRNELGKEGKEGREKESKKKRRYGEAAHAKRRDDFGYEEAPDNDAQLLSRAMIFLSGPCARWTPFLLCERKACQPSPRRCINGSRRVSEWPREAKESLRVTHDCRGRRAGTWAGATGSGSVRDSRHLGAWGRGAREKPREKQRIRYRTWVSALKTQLGHVTAGPPSLMHQGTYQCPTAQPAPLPHPLLGSVCVCDVRPAIEAKAN